MEKCQEIIKKKKMRNCRGEIKHEVKQIRDKTEIYKVIVRAQKMEKIDIR